MYRVFACITGVDDEVMRLFTKLCPGAVLPDVRRGVPASIDGTEWGSITADIVGGGGAPVRSDG